MSSFFPGTVFVVWHTFEATYLKLLAARRKQTILQWVICKIYQYWVRACCTFYLVFIVAGDKTFCFQEYHCGSNYLCHNSKHVNISFKHLVSRHNIFVFQRYLHTFCLCLSLWRLKKEDFWSIQINSQQNLKR